MLVGVFDVRTHSDKDNVSMLEVLRQLAVVAHHAEIKRVNSLEIVCIKHVLSAGAGRRVLPEVRLEQGQNWTEHRETRRAERFATFFQPP